MARSTSPAYRCGDRVTKRISWSSFIAPVAVLAALAAADMYALQEIVWSDSDRLPGNDSVNLYFWEFFTRKVLATGSLPYWNPYHMTGTPHMADLQTTVWYPPAMLLRVLPPMVYLSWMAALHVWLTGVGGVVLARVLGLSWLAALAAGMAMMLGGSVGPWLYNGHLLVLYCATWLPWALALTIVSVRSGKRVPHPALVVVMVLQFLAGYLQGSLYITAVVAGCFVYSALFPAMPATPAARRRPLIQLAVLGALALGLSAFQLLPLFQLTAAAGRTSGLPYSVASEGGLRLVDLARLFFPFRDVPADPPYRFLADGLTYVGWVLAALVPFAFLDRTRRREVMFLLIATAVVIAVAAAADLPFYRIHYLLVPGLRIPGRMLFIATVTLATLGVIGLESFIRLSRSRDWRTMAPAAMAGALFIATAAAVTLSRSSVIAPSHAWPLLPLLSLGVLFAVAPISAAGWSRTALILAVGCICFDVVTFAAPAPHTVSIETAATMRRVMGPPDSGRGVSVCENRIGPGEFLVNGQATVDGLAAMHLATFADWAALAGSGDAPPHDGLYRRISSVGVLPARPDLLNLANVSLLYSCEPIAAPGLTLVSHVGPIYRYRNEAVWPRVFWTCDVQEATAVDATDWLLSGRYDERRWHARPSINVRWASGTSDDGRRSIEQRRHLVDGARREGTTWRYALDDSSAANVLALLQEPAVEDTAGIDRRTGAVLKPPPESVRVTQGGGDWVVGSRDCGETASTELLPVDRSDGMVDVDVNAPRDGFIFLSEAHYPERRAFVDGEPTAALRANLTFTAIPVRAGHHRVQLRYVPRSFHAGLAISGMTLLSWVALSRLRRRNAAKEAAGVA